MPVSALDVGAHDVPGHFFLNGYQLVYGPHDWSESSTGGERRQLRGAMGSRRDTNLVGDSACSRFLVTFENVLHPLKALLILSRDLLLPHQQYLVS